MKIGIIGDKKSVLGFKALGVKTFGVNTKDDFYNVLERVKNENFGILFITEDIAKEYPQEIEELSTQTLPAVVIIPGVKGPLGEGLKSLKKIVERSLGSDILKIT